MTVNMTAPLEIGFCVRDMKKMIDFYTEILGFTYINLAEATKDASQASGFTPSGYEIVRLQTGYGERIKLNRPTDTPLERPTDQHILERKGTAYLTFIIQDLDEMASRLIKAGYAVLPEKGKIEVRPGVKLFTSKDPEGNHLEFVEYSNISEYRKDLFG